MPKPLEKTVSLPTGLEISYAESGDRAGAPLVMLHGYTDSWRSHRRLMAALPSWVRCIALSLRGHGDSAKPRSSYTAAELAGDVLMFLGAIALDRAVVLGHSMSSAVARRVALGAPHRAAGLVLIGSLFDLGNKPGVAELGEALESSGDPVDSALVRAFQESTVYQPIPESFWRSAIAESSKVPLHVWRSAFAAQLREDDSSEVAAIRAPALVVWGEHDVYSTRSEQEALAGALPNAAFAVVGGAGHAPHWEKPSEVASAIAAFPPLRALCRTMSSSDSTPELESP